MILGWIPSNIPKYVPAKFQRDLTGISTETSMGIEIIKQRIVNPKLKYFINT